MIFSFWNFPSPPPCTVSYNSGTNGIDKGMSVYILPEEKKDGFLFYFLLLLLAKYKVASIILMEHFQLESKINFMTKHNISDQKLVSHFGYYNFNWSSLFHCKKFLLPWQNTFIRILIPQSNSNKFLVYLFPPVKLQVY